MSKGKLIQCAICGKTFYNAISKTHLAEHSITLSEYRKEYGPTSVSSLKYAAVKQFSPKHIIHEALRRQDDEALDAVLSSITESKLRTFSKDAKDMIIGTVLSLARERMKTYVKATEIHNNALEELSQPWRLEMDENGNPLSNKQVMEVIEVMRQERNDAFKHFSNLTKEVVQDNRTVLGKFGDGGESAFKGDADKVDLQKIPPYYREKMRQIIGLMTDMSPEERATFLQRFKNKVSVDTEEVFVESRPEPLLLIENGEVIDE